MDILIIIPARMGSSRFPGKPMSKIHNYPMIEHVYKNSLSHDWDTYIATCDKVIFDFIKSINGKVVMTSKKHKRAADRSAEALENIEKISKKKYDIIVMVQGDEPMIDTQMIKTAIKTLIKSKDADVVNLYSEIKNKDEFYNKNIVKVIFNKNKEALFFVRKPSNSFFVLKKSNFIGKQVCVIPFRKQALKKFIKLKPTNLEIVESVDMFRLIENGIKIKLAKCNKKTYCVDVRADIKVVEKFIKL